MNKISKVTTLFQSSVKRSGHESALISLPLESPKGSDPGSALSGGLIAPSSFQGFVSLSQTGDLSPLRARHCGRQPVSASFSLPGSFFLWGWELSLFQSLLAEAIRQRG